MRSRRIATAVLGLSLAVTVAGCGSDEKEPASSATPSSSVKPTANPTSLSLDQLATALIQLADLGPGYKTIKASTDPAPGCLSPLDVTNGGFSNAIKYVHADFSADTDNGIPEVNTLINSFDTAATAAKALGDLGSGLSDCTTVSATQNGATYDLAVTTSDDKTSSDVDHQVNVKAVGKVSGPGGSIDVALYASFLQVGPIILGTGYSNTLTNTDSDSAKVATLALGRLIDLLGGSTPKPAPIDLPVFTGQLGQ